MNKNDQDFLVQKIRTQYIEKEHTALDELRALDSKVKRPALTSAYILGSIGAIIMGGGMSLIMTDIADMIGMQNPMPYGIVIGVLGLLMTIVNYPIYKKLLEKRRSKYAERILELSDRITSM